MVFWSVVDDDGHHRHDAEGLVVGLIYRELNAVVLEVETAEFTVFIIG